MAAAGAVSLAVGLGACVLGITGCQAGPERMKQAVPVTTPAQRIEQKAPESQEIGWLTVQLEGAPPESLLSVKPENLPAHIHSIYRLRPDRRFLYAVAELRRLSSGGPRRGKMNIQFEENRWRLSLDGSPIGDLPEFPSFADARALLL